MRLGSGTVTADLVGKDSLAGVIVRVKKMKTGEMRMTGLSWNEKRLVGRDKIDKKSQQTLRYIKIRNVEDNLAVSTIMQICTQLSVVHSNCHASMRHTK